jgi:acyl-CoA thioesterase-2
MADLWSDLLDCLDLRPEPVTAGAPAEFTADNQRLRYHRLFGGQLLAQFVRAASLGCPGKSVKSVHALFPRAGDAAEPVRYEVTTHHAGTSFATLSIVARQSAGVIATAAVSMHAAEHGPDRQSIPPVPELPGEQHRVELELLPWDTRATTDLDAPAAAPPEYELWMRTPPAPPELGPAIAAYATDLSVIGTALLAVDGVSQRDAGTAFASAVTAHTLWFHRPVRTDGWLLLRQHAPIVAHGRCFGRGDVITGGGALVASYAQEALLRFRAGA